jgi:hypothetical protein
MEVKEATRPTTPRPNITRLGIDVINIDEGPEDGSNGDFREGEERR